MISPDTPKSTHIRERYRLVGGPWGGQDIEVGRLRPRIYLLDPVEGEPFCRSPVFDARRHEYDFQRIGYDAGFRDVVFVHSIYREDGRPEKAKLRWLMIEFDYSKPSPWPARKCLCV